MIEFFSLREVGNTQDLQEKKIFPIYDNQIRVIGSIEREKGTRVTRNLTEKLRGKFSSAPLGYSVVRITILMMLSLELLNWKQSRRKKKEKEKNERQKHTPQKSDLCEYLSKNVIKHNVSGNEDKRSCCTCHLG